MMDDQEITVWTVIKRFLLGWGIAFGVIVVISCVRHKEFIMATFTNNMWVWINAMMPAVIVVFVVFYLIKSLFGRSI